MTTTGGRAGGRPASWSPKASASMARSGASRPRPLCTSWGASGYRGRSRAATRRATPIPLPTRTARRRSCSGAGSAGPSRSSAVNTWQAATTRRVRMCSPELVTTAATWPSFTSMARAPSPRRSCPPVARSRATRASLSAPEPPTGRPGGCSCIIALHPRCPAVPGSDIGGPDCAPIQASALASRSSANVSSSTASPGERNWRPISMPLASRCLPARQAARPSRPGVGGALNASIIGRIRCAQSVTNPRYARASALPHTAAMLSQVRSRSA